MVFDRNTDMPISDTPSPGLQAQLYRYPSLQVDLLNLAQPKSTLDKPHKALILKRLCEPSLRVPSKPSCLLELRVGLRESLRPRMDPDAAWPAAESSRGPGGVWGGPVVPCALRGS